MLHTSVEQSFLMMLIFHICDTQRNAAKCFIWYKVITLIRTTEPIHFLFTHSIIEASKNHAECTVNTQTSFLGILVPSFHHPSVPSWIVQLPFKGNYFGQAWMEAGWTELSSNLKQESNFSFFYCCHKYFPYALWGFFKRFAHMEKKYYVNK